MLQPRRLSTGLRESSSSSGTLVLARAIEIKIKRKRKSAEDWLARHAPARLLSERVMHFSVRQALAIISIGSLIFWCSCEKHPLGQDPEVQKENVDGAKGGEEHAAPKKADVPETEMKSPTPAEFFPKTTPSP